MAASAPTTHSPKPAAGALLLWQSMALLSAAQMRRLSVLLGELVPALETRCPLRWSQLERVIHCRLLFRAGVVVLSREQLKRQRHEPKRGARPIALAYFGPPIDQHCELYILDVQTRLLRKPLHVPPLNPKD